jgi:Uma2 family endonuclease
MTIAATTPTWTDEAFMALPQDGHHYELIHGEVINRGNSGMAHGYVACLITIQLGGYIKAQKLGAVCDSSTAFTLKNGNKRSPDFSFVHRDRLQGLRYPPRGFFQGAPDLAVEILSPGNTVEEIHTKIVEYFDNGTQIVWVIHPDEKYVLVYHSVEPDRFLRSDDRLDGEDLIPGFSMAIADLFEPWDF